jgi:hypothetical protein
MLSVDSDGSFRCIAAMSMRWHQLVLVLLVSDELLDKVRAFVVENMNARC